ncbi:unnamed protein product [Trichobilharzia regenti]|nr:unnamed protein product [Trichobilharzia regenti]
MGGGILGTGCVQEEIMFALRPELLISCLFVECLDPDETLIIEGAEQYSVGSGYADNFCWAGDFDHSKSGMKRCILRMLLHTLSHGGLLFANPGTTGKDGEVVVSWRGERQLCWATIYSSIMTSCDTR